MADELKHENYISPFADDPEYWWKHHNGLLLHDYQRLIYGKVADIGCNHGALTSKVGTLDPVKTVTGFDNSEAAIALAHKENSSYNVNFKLLDLRRERPYGYYHFMYAFHFLEHIERLYLRQVIDHMFRSIYPGGHILISVPYKDAYPSEYHENEFDERDIEMLFGAPATRDQRIDGHGNKHDCIVCLVKI